MQVRGCSLLILALLAGAFPAHASDFFPIDTGRSWSYSTPGGGSFGLFVDSPQSFAGVLAQPVKRGGNHSSREYYSKDGTGRTFMHGASFPDGNYVVFDPPNLRMDSDLTPGHQWETTYEEISYDVNDVETGRSTVSISYYVVAVETVNVPAGSFQAVDILITQNRNPFPVFVYHQWYADGVGYVRQFHAPSNTAVELLNYSTTTATERVTWGAVKAKYKN